MGDAALHGTLALQIDQVRILYLNCRLFLCFRKISKANIILAAKLLHGC